MVHRLLPFVVLLTTTIAQAPAWPGFRGPLRDGVAHAQKPPREWSDDDNLKWKTELPGPGASSPIVVGDRVLVTCYTGYGKHAEDGGDPKKLMHHVVCLDRRDGKKLWQRDVPGPLDQEARQVQITEHGFATPTPISDGKAIWVYLGDAGVVAFDLDGERLWQRDLGKPDPNAPKPTNSVEREGKVLSLRWGSAASPLLHDGLVIVNASEQSNSIRALDQRTGELVWKRESSNLEGCAISPMIAGTTAAPVLVIVLAGEVWGMDPKTGEPLWTVETGTRGGMAPTPLTDGEHVYAFGGGGKSFAIRLRPDGDDRVAWQGDNVGVPSPVLHDGRIYLVNQRGIATCIRQRDGEKLFGGRLEGRTSGVYASPTIADGHLYVVSRERGVFVYRPKDDGLELVARNELSDASQFHASPAIADNALFLRSETHLYCIAEG